MKTTFTFFTKKLAPTAIFLDFDETLALSERNPDGSYVIQKDGSINATIMDKERLKQMVEAAVQFDIPLHIVTARADVPTDKSTIENVIASVNGFSNTLGGFKREHIHFCSIKPEGKWQQVKTKEEVLIALHKSLYSHLERHRLLFVDDMVKYLEGARKAGFSTYQANPETKAHYAVIQNCITTQGRCLIEDDMTAEEMADSVFGRQCWSKG